MDDLDEFIAGLEKAGRSVSEEANKILDKVSPIAVQTLKSEIEQASNRGYSTGDLKNSIQATKAKENRLGNFTAVRPTGTNKRGVRNGEVLGYLEHGVKSHGQEARPVLQKSARKSEKVLFEECEKMLERLTDF